MRLIAIFFLSIFSSCILSDESNQDSYANIILGNEQLNLYTTLLDGKKVGIVANHTSLIYGKHLVDSLLSLQINIVKIFSPEHGFRGEIEAGELVGNQIDTQTNLPVISLYGNRKKPANSDIKEVDIMLFDMQDVGVRFYTYISTMHYVMEACAENGIPLIILDRPNPNGWYVDGPVLDTNFRSFVGMHPVPLVHGMTIGEFAQMINGEGWLENKVKCDLTIIKCENYSHDTKYILPVKPSPNLPNQTSIYLYPSLGFFEGTVISIGRGTDFPFQIFGNPELPFSGYSFTPESRPGASANPPLLGEICNGYDLRDYSYDYFYSLKSINLEWLIYAYKSYPNKDEFFNSYFNLLAGNSTLKEQIIKGLDADSIRNSWTQEINSFINCRKKYLLYKDFKTENGTERGVE